MGGSPLGGGVGGGGSAVQCFLFQILFVWLGPGMDQEARDSLDGTESFNDAEEVSRLYYNLRFYKI